MKKTVRYLFLIFAGFLVFSFSAFGEVTCIQVNPNQWVCSGAGVGGEYPPIVVTNVVGVCTNCVAISPDECTAFKNKALYDLVQIEGALSWNEYLVRSTIDSIEQLKSEGDSFKPVFDWTGISRTSPLREELENTEQYKYLIDYQNNPINPDNSISLQRGGGSANSVANYYYTSVEPVLDNALEMLRPELDNYQVYQNQLSSMQHTIEDLSCDSCTASFDGPSTPSGGSGGGGSSSCTDCPCKEQFNALLSVLNKTSSDVNHISNVVVQISTSIEKFRKQNHADLLALSNLTYRIDHYVENDLDKYLESLKTSVIVLSNNVDSIQRYYFEKYKVADTFSVPSVADTVFSKDADGNDSFDSSEYASLNWFERIELLLFHLAVPSASTITNNVDDISSDADDMTDSINHDLKSFEGAFDFLSSDAQTVGGDIARGFTALGNAFKPDSSSGELVLVPGEYWFGDKNKDMKLSFDSGLVDLLRALSSCLWSVLALLAAMKIFIFGVHLCSAWFKFTAWFTKMVIG